MNGCIKNSGSKGKKPSKRRSVSFNITVKAVQLPDSAKRAWDDTKFSDWTKMEKTARLGREPLKAGQLRFMRCRNPSCFIGDKHGNNPHCTCGQTVIDWEPRFSNDDPLCWKLNSMSGMWTNAVTGKRMFYAPQCISEERHTPPKIEDEHTPAGDLIELPDSVLSTEGEPTLGPKDDVPVLWDNLLISNWTILAGKSEVDTIAIVSSPEFSRKFWDFVDTHIATRKRKMQEKGDILSPSQMVTLLTVAEKYRGCTECGEDPVEYMLEDEDIKREFPIETKTRRLLKGGFCLGNKQRASLVLIKASFVCMCEMAICGTLKNADIKKRDFYTALRNSARHHGADLRKRKDKMMFSGGFSLPCTNYTPEKNVFFCAAYEEIARQAQQKIEGH